MPDGLGCSFDGWLRSLDEGGFAAASTLGFAAPHLHQQTPAVRAWLRQRALPTGKVTLRVAAATEEFLAAPRAFDDDFAAFFRAANRA